MASSSSSSQFKSAFVSQSWSHDVFLSFRGEDTRKGFVDHLYAALVQQGINTYKDDETLARGESIGPALRKAIQESRIAIIVFSKNYADSSWCLDELSYIIECKDKRGQIVMTVFYDVDPSDVRKQKREYVEAFTKHECDYKHKIESWRKALVEASNLSGWVPKDFANGHEAKCIKDIVATISSRLYPLINNVNKNLIGIETRLQDLKSMLEILSGGVRIVGIWGVGGGGKTTLALAAYTEISHQFEACFLLENVREESSKHGLRKLQKKFLSLVLNQKTKVGSEMEGRNMIKSRLCHKRVLVVLDDVDDLKQLEALAGSHDWFGEGSRIIITTRDEHLLTRHADKIYEVNLLSHDEAIILFGRHAYRKDKPIEDYDGLSQEAVSFAGGLPLALEVLGSFLYDKDKDEWISALTKLKCIPNAKVMERLKISYDGLEHDEKELFLDIACFLRRWEIDRAMRVLEGCSFYPRIGVKVLAQKSLMKVSNGRFDMHDLVEEMAHYIVRGEHPNHPEKRSRIWQEKDIVEFCATTAETLMENNHIEVLALPSYISHPTLPHIGGFKDKDYHLFKFINSPLPSYVSHPRLPDVVANMKKLRLIYWEGYPASSLPTNFHPTKLGCLILIRGQQKHMWQGCKELPNLKILDLRNSILLNMTPDFNGLPCLERLILEDCIGLKQIHPSIGYHERLVYVNMKGCSKLQMFPLITRMTKLETLDLSFCDELRKFPDIQRNMDSLVNLDLNWNGIKIIPSSFGQFCTNLVSLDLSNCENLKRIDGNFRLLKCLKYLTLSGCWQLEKLAPDFFYEECCLEELSLSLTCSTLPQFPRFLRKLGLRECNLRDGDIPSNMSSLLNLEVLDLSYNHFSRLHSSLSQIPCLKFLNLSQCDNLVELPDISSLSCLERLDLGGCNRLEEIHPSIGHHERLVWVKMNGCGKLKVFPPIIQMKNLETLDLSGCSELQKFPDIQRNMDSLVKLHFCGTGIEIIPPSVGQFCTNLVYFDVTECNKLKRIEGNFRLLKRLKTFRLDNCKQLEKLAKDFFNEECCLEKLSLSMIKSQRVNTLQQNSTAFHQDSPMLPQFPHFLRRLDLIRCNLGDGDVPSDMSGLLNLQVLNLSYNNFSQLHLGFSHIPCLKFLNLSYCPNLVKLSALPSSIVSLRAEYCESLQRVEDLSNCKWLSKVSLWRESETKLIGGERVLHSMLQNAWQRNALEDHFMSMALPGVRFSNSWGELTTITLQLPPSWYNDFSGFLLCADECWKYSEYSIHIKQEMLTMDYQPDHWEEFNKNHESYENGLVGYVPFGSLRQTSWWNHRYTSITFDTRGIINPKVGLVPSKSKSSESRDTAIDCLECWEEYRFETTFEIKVDSESSEVKIEWYPSFSY